MCRWSPDTVNREQNIKDSKSTQFLWQGNARAQMLDKREVEHPRLLFNNSNNY